MKFFSSGARLAAALFAVSCAHAAVQLPYLISDHMVLQRGIPVHIWGKAEPGERVTVAFHGTERTATTDALGRWSLYLPPVDAGGPFTMSIRGANAIELTDILVGEVWVASGQSNMEWPVAWAANAQAETAAGKFPRIRLVRAAHKVSEYPMPDLVGEMWRPCTPETVANFSAVAYHFGRLLHERLGVPVGLIQTAWGGTRLEAWTSLGAISRDPALMPVIADWDAYMQDHALELLRYHRAAKDWEREVPRLKAEHKQLPPPPEKPIGPGGPRTPGGIYNAMVAPVTPFAIRGVIWYQGEANGAATQAQLYGHLFQTMIADWRRAWGLGDFPFLYVQLANYISPEGAWPVLREGQRHALALRNTAMAVTIDVGTPDDIHPRDKKTVGQRLSLAARAIAYGEQIEYSGPLPRQVTEEQGALRVWFDHAAGLASRSGTLKGFEIAGADRKFAPAAAQIEGGSILVRSRDVPWPQFVRYGWHDNPDCNLVNAAGLPASPFVLP